MSQYPGYSAEQKYRVAWKGGASESMTLDEARLWLREREGDGVSYRVEEWNGWEWLGMGEGMGRITVFFAWYDFWIGAFYDQKKRVLYVCPLPCCVFRIELGGVAAKELNHG